MRDAAGQNTEALQLLRLEHLLFELFPVRDLPEQALARGGEGVRHPDTVLFLPFPLHGAPAEVVLEVQLRGHEVQHRQDQSRQGGRESGRESEMAQA